ncbi:GTA-gp10 family protein [Tardiphaga alba]|uniref:GTA-gp10 family protein n=1 Tax=Tardiphaga alba TaxID=340268 RepID=UPI001BACB203|nr:GTA-gp10 family protein [Tardiphaga alba]
MFDLASPRVRWMLRQQPFPGQYGDTPTACLRRFDERVYSPNDVEQIIRIGLIGGGESPESADAIIATHITGQPMATNAMLANAVLVRLFVGDEVDGA